MNEPKFGDPRWKGGGVSLREIFDLKRRQTKGTQMDPKKKYYVGAERLTLGWSKATLAEAIAHAKQILNENTDREEATIVQVVRVVRRQRVPLVVEKI